MLLFFFLSFFFFFIVLFFFFFFFFSSRRRHTRCLSDWSSECALPIFAALQALTLGDEVEKRSPADQRALRNLPARAYYGVNSDEAVTLRVLGVPRTAAPRLADEIGRASCRERVEISVVGVCLTNI